MQPGSLTRGPEVRRNIIANPNFEIGASGAVGTRCTISSSSDRAWVGSRSLKIEALGTGATFVAWASITAVAGASYTSSFRVYAQSGIGYVNHNLSFYNSAGTLISPEHNTGYESVTQGEWVARTYQATAPAGTATMRVLVNVRSPSNTNPAAGATAYVDGMYLGPVGSYFDGSSTSNGFVNEWAGTSNSSESIQYLERNTDVQEFTSRVIVSGVERDVDSWSIDRENSGGLPRVLDPSASGITQATGSIEFSGQDVTNRSVTPLNQGYGWLPSKGDRVQIFVGDGVNEWSQFVGVIDEVSGTVGEGFQATVIDLYDRLSTEARHVPLLRAMPPRIGNGNPYRNMGLTAQYYIDHFLRLAGFHATPPPEANALLAAHGVDSTWAVVGSLDTTATSGVDENQHPTSYRAPWGVCLGDFTATYIPAITPNASDPIQMTVCVAPEHSQFGYIRAHYGSTYLQLNISADRTAQAYVGGVLVPGLSLPLGVATVVSALFKGGKVTLRSNTGQEVTATVTAPASQQISKITVYGSVGARIAGFQVSKPATAAQELVSPTRTPTAHFNTDFRSLMSFIDAAPSFKGRSVAEVLEELCEAKLSSLWIDELGVMQWADAETLERRASVRTVTTLDDIVSMGWRAALTQSASKVTVKSERPAITVGRYKNRVLVEGGNSSETLKSNDEVEIILEPADDETWIMPNVAFTQVGGASGAWSLANDPERSLVGMYYSADGGTTEATGLACTITTEVLDYEKFLIRYVAGVWPSDVEGVIATSPTNATLWPKNRDKALPKLVGQGKVVWSEREYSISDTGGAGPELVHETGYWCNRSKDDTILQRYAEFLRDRTINPQPFVDGLEIIPDPRIQLGDVITVESDVLLGAEFKALIKKVSTSFGSDGLSMQLDVRVLSVTRTAMTYQEFQSSLAGSSLTYAQFNALAPTPQTYAEFNNQI